MKALLHSMLFSLTIWLLLGGCAGTPPPSKGLASVGKVQDTSLHTPAAVAPVERMQRYPSPGEYVAFSLRVAQQRITAVGTGRDYRTVYPEVYQLGGITQLYGLVYDPHTHEVILVGHYNPDRQPLTLDDLAVALRVRFIHGQWPVVSIDPTEDTPRTGMQRVRFEGGIAETQFGSDLLDADYRLKQIGMGLLPPGIRGLATAWDLELDQAQRHPAGTRQISARFWFYPVLPSVTVRQNVGTIKGLKVVVRTEVLAATIDGKVIADLATFQNEEDERFAQGVSERFEELAKVHPSFSRLQGLAELVALTRALEAMDDKPDLAFWLSAYQVKPVETAKGIKVLQRAETYDVPGRGAGARRSLTIAVAGGVQLMAVALRLNAGDVTALQEAVFKTRPQPETLSWHFMVGEWLIPTSPGMHDLKDLIPLWTQADFLYRKKRYADAITILGKLIELKADWDEPYNNRGMLYTETGQPALALADFAKALALNPRLEGAYYNRGNVYARQGQYERALADYAQALALNPTYTDAYINRGNVYDLQAQHHRALADYAQVLALNPQNATAYYNRGRVYMAQGQYERALADWRKALEINPTYTAAYYARGNVYARQGQYERALADYAQALGLNPKDADAYNNRGYVYAQQGQYERALADFAQALALNPQDATAYYNRGRVYTLQGQYERALADYAQALALNPKDANTYFNQAIIYEKIGRPRKAIEAYRGFIHYASPQDATRLQQATKRIQALAR